MKKYKATIGARGCKEARITPVEVERETAASVWIQGQRRAKNSEYETFFDSFDDAKQALISAQESYAKVCEANFLKAKLVLEEIQAMEEE